MEDVGSREDEGERAISWQGLGYKGGRWGQRVSSMELVSLARPSKKLNSITRFERRISALAGKLSPMARNRVLSFIRNPKDCARTSV